MPFRKIVFWEPSASPHKADLFEAMATLLPDASVTCVADQGLLPERQSMGWRLKQPVRYELIVAPGEQTIDELIDGCPSVLHIFSGIRHVPTIVAALRLVRRRSACFGIMHEPRVAEGWKGLLRRIQSWLTEGWLRRKVAFVLAIGRNGPPWFLSVGYSEQRIFPYAYFVDASDTLPRAERTVEPNPVHVGFVGRVTRAKGVEDLLEAIRGCANTRLSIVGAGDLSDRLRQRSAELGLNVDFVGPKLITEIPALMGHFDVLVLPSTTTDDGWGVVVNEALLSGTAVIATRCVGASVVLDDPLLGACVSANAPEEIANAIERLRGARAFAPETRGLRASRAADMLTGTAGAVALSEVIAFVFLGAVRPKPFYQHKERTLA